MLNNENVWAKAMNRVVNEKVPVGQGDRRDDRAHQAGRGLDAHRGVAPRPRARVEGRGRAFAGAPARCPRIASSRHASRSPAGPAKQRMVALADLGADPARALPRSSSWSSCCTRSATGCGWRAIRRATRSCSTTRSSSASVVNTLVFLVVAINVKMMVALVLSGFFVARAAWIKWLSRALHPAVGGAVDPDDPVGPLHAQPRVGHHQLADLPAAPGSDGPNWLNDPTLALSLSMLVHIWKSLPFWTLILIAGRLAIPGRAVRGRRRSTARRAGRSSASSPGRRCARST